MSHSYVPRINIGGNFCGHDPLAPKLKLDNPAKKGAGGQPRVITLLMERMTQYYFNPAKIPSLNLANGSDRQMRSERREACIVVLAALLKNMDLSSLRVGQPTKNGFLNYTFDWLAAHTGLPLWRVDRSVRDLKQAGLLTISQPRQLKEDGTWKGLAAVKAISKHLFGVFGLHKMLQIEQKKAVTRLKKKAKEWQANDGQKRTLTDLSRLSLVVSGLKTNPLKKSKRRPPPPPDCRVDDYSESINQSLENLKKRFSN